MDYSLDVHVRTLDIYKNVELKASQMRETSDLTMATKIAEWRILA